MSGAESEWVLGVSDETWRAGRGPGLLPHARRRRRGGVARSPPSVTAQGAQWIPSARPRHLAAPRSATRDAYHVRNKLYAVLWINTQWKMKKENWRRLRARRLPRSVFIIVINNLLLMFTWNSRCVRLFANVCLRLSDCFLRALRL